MYLLPFYRVIRDKTRMYLLPFYPKTIAFSYFPLEKEYTVGYRHGLDAYNSL